MIDVDEVSVTLVADGTALRRRLLMAQLVGATLTSEGARGMQFEARATLQARAGGGGGGGVLFFALCRADIV